MGNILKFILFGSTFWSLLFCSREPDQFVQFITDLKEVAAKDRNTAITQYANVQSWPLIEKDKVYFLMKSSGAKKVFLAGDMNGWKADSIALMKIPGTDYFFVEQSFPQDARLEYKFVVDGNFTLDSFNPKLTKGGFAENSFLIMPEYIFPSHILIKRSSRISRIDTIQFDSRLLNNTRPVYLYQHPDAHGNSPLIIFHDGSDYLKFGHARTILDNLIADGSIPAVKAIFVDPVDRMNEYWLKDAYLKMIFTELLPDIREQAKIKNDTRLVMGGASLGGLVSLYALKNYSNQLEGVFSQSGAIWIEQEKILDVIEGLSMVTSKIYFDYGSFETKISKTHVKLETILKNNTIKFDSKLYNEGHNWANWRAHLPEALIFCLKKELVK